MKSRWSVVLMVAGVTAVTIFIVSRDLQRAQEQQQQSEGLSSGSANLEAVPAPTPIYLEQEELTGQPQHAYLEDRIEPENLLDLVADRHSLPETKAPPELPPADNLDPVPLLTPERRRANEEIIREVIPDVTDEDLELWLEETRDLEPNMIRNMLKLRQQFGGLTETFDAENSDARLSAQSSPHKSARAKTEPVIVQQDPILKSLKRARGMVLQNQSNVNSIGYLSMKLFFVEAYDDGVPAGIRLARSTLSMEQEEYLSTGRMLDIALEPQYFLSVHGDDGNRLTRYGSLKLSKQRRLQLAIEQIDLFVSNIDPIPEEFVRIGIDEQGQVMASTKMEGLKTEDWKEVGKLELVTVRHPSALKPVGDGCYVTTTESGPATPVVIGKETKLLTAGVLTKSNVDPQRESWTLDRINGWIKMREQQLSTENEGL